MRSDDIKYIHIYTNVTTVAVGINEYTYFFFRIVVVKV